MTQLDVLSAALTPPERIGPYRILKVLGVGGMGVVYEADEVGPVKRRVALKVVRDLFASKEILARFDVERQALAVMNHPGIARVLQAGATETGQPWFAMELVRGLPITQFCDDRRLGVPERLQLFIAVCHAVQHAHQKGVVHRDLKPSNILVTDESGQRLPKIIDFGIAKALGHQLTEKTLVTQLGHAVGTAAYMSPEQAESSGLDVDTRSDIYSLGVLLYELLVGRLPVDPAVMGIHAFLTQLMMRDTFPPRPSVKLAELGEKQTLVADARRSDPARLMRELAGDLDWIVMKAMDPDRSRRYPTANALALDLQRHLANEPILARPPATVYRMGKFVRRHRTAVLAAVATTLVVLASAGFTTVGMVRATRAERRAAEEAAAARQVTDFLVELFRISDPSEARGNAVTAREILDRGSARVVRDLADRPDLQSRVLQTIGTVYGSLGLYPQARTVLEQALQVRQRTLGRSDTLVAQTLASLGAIASARGDFADADQHFSRALAIRIGVLGATHPDVAATLLGLAGLRTRQGNFAEAETLYRRALAIDEGAREPDDRRIAKALMGLAVVHWSQRQYDQAEPLMRRALLLQERALGLEHPEVAATLNNLGGLYWMQGRYADALPLYERTRRIFEKSFDPRHPDVASNLNNLGETYWKLGRYAEAEPLFRRALAVKEQVLAPTHPSLAVTLNGLAGMLRDQRRFAEAEALYRRALTIREQAFGADHATTRETLRDYAVLLRAAGRASEAAALEQRAR